MEFKMAEIFTLSRPICERENISFLIQVYLCAYVVIRWNRMIRANMVINHRRMKVSLAPASVALPVQEGLRRRGQEFTHDVRSPRFLAKSTNMPSYTYLHAKTNIGKWLARTFPRPSRT